jgi:predicted anti-sigma-YlaC factor YlaD
MTCKETQRHLSAYLDRQLKPADVSEVRLHLETCAACRTEERSILQLKETLRTVRMPEIPADLIAAIEAETIFKPRWWEMPAGQMRWAPALMGLALALGAFYLLGSSHSPLRGDPTIIARGPSISTAPVVAMHRDQEPDPTEKVH